MAIIQRKFVWNTLYLDPSTAAPLWINMTQYSFLFYVHKSMLVISSLHSVWL
jgi:hypothetical protein